MENTDLQQNNDKHFIESIDYLLQLTKYHFNFLVHPFSDLEDKVITTNTFLNQFFKVLVKGFGSLPNNIDISCLMHLMTVKNFIGFGDEIKVHKISQVLKPKIDQQSKAVQTINQTKEVTMQTNDLENPKKSKSEMIKQWKKRYPLLNNLTESESGIKNISIKTVDYFIVQALLN